MIFFSRTRTSVKTIVSDKGNHSTEMMM